VWKASVLKTSFKAKKITTNDMACLTVAYLITREDTDHAKVVTSQVQIV